MSRFLGPIHYWLFNKIKLHEDLEQDIIKRLKSQYGDDIDSIVGETVNQYGEPLPNKPLEDMIDTDNIHGWLQKRISIAETRQAALLGDAFKKYDGDAIELVKLAYEDHGMISGKDAAEKNNLDTAEALYKALNNYILDGMPCDQANRVTKAEDDYLEYKQTQCLHIGYWNETGVNSEVMYDLRRTWTEAFVNSANPDFKYQVNIENIGGEDGFNHKIFKK